MKITHYRNYNACIRLTMPEYFALRSFLLDSSVSSMFRDSANSSVRAESVDNILKAFFNSKI